MAKSPIQTLQDQWNNRAGQYLQAGGDPTQLQGVFAADKRNVLAGHAPMSNEEAMAAMSAAQGKPIINPNPDPPSSVRSVPTNAISDVEHMILGVPPALGRLAWHSAADVLHGHAPSIVSQGIGMFTHNKDPQWAAAHGYVQAHNLGDQLRNFAHNPLLQLMPGISALGEATTQEGRKQFTEHPIQSLLDVTPILGEVSGLGALARAGEFGAEGEMTSTLSSVGKDLQAAGGDQSAIDPMALSKAKYYNSLIDTTVDASGATKKVTFHPMKAAFSHVESLAEAAPHAQKLVGVLSHDIRQKLYASKSIAERTLMLKFVSEISAIPGIQQLDATAREDIGRTVQAPGFKLGDVSTYNNHDPKVIEGVARISTEMEKTLVDQGVLASIMVTTPEGPKEFFFKKSGLAAKAWGRLLDAKQQLALLKEDPAIIESINASHTTDPVELTKIRKVHLKRLDDANKEIVKAANQLEAAFKKEAPVNFYQAADDRMSTSIKDLVVQMGNKGHINPTVKDEAIRAMDTSVGFKEVGEILAKGGPKAVEDFKNWQQDNISFWRDLANAGHSPVFLGHVDVNAAKALDRVRGHVGFKQLTDQALFKHALDGTPSSRDFAYGLGTIGKLMLENKASMQYESQIMKSFGRKMEQTRQIFETQFSNTIRGKRLQSIDSKQFQLHIDKKLQTDYKPVRAGKGPMEWSDDFKYNPETDRLIPVGVHEALKKVMNMGTGRLDVNLGRVDKWTHLYKVAVMFGPRHLAHIAFGGTMMIMLADPGALKDVFRAASNLHQIEKFIPEILAKVDDWTADQSFHFNAGNSLGKLYQQTIGKQINNLHRVEDYTLRLQRATIAVHIAGSVENLAPTAENMLLRDRALTEISKVLIYTDDMSPMERGILKQVFPFYTFMKHVLRYVFTYPGDHPMAASIISSIVRQEQEEMAQGLPEQFQSLFYLGKPDAGGNVWTMDLRNFNPFRSITSDLTIAGFLGNLSPVIQAGLAAGGYDPNKGSALYPELQVDPVTGALQSKTGLSAGAQNIAQDVPGYDIINHYLPFTHDVKDLKANNPEAYNASAFSAWRLPLTTIKRNIPAMRAKYEDERFKVAQQEVAAAMTSGNFSHLGEFGAVPYSGTWISPQELQQRYDQAYRTLLNAGLSGPVVKALLPKPRPTKTKFTLSELENSYGNQLNLSPQGI